MDMRKHAASSATRDRDNIVAARTLSEALPYLQRYDGSTIVIKFGGHAMGDDAAMRGFARDVVLMKQCNVHPVIVHGGGPMINDMLRRLDIRSEFVDGRRVSSAEVVEVVEMVLSGRINKRIVQAINDEGGNGVGLSGKDARLMVCEKEFGTVMRDGAAVQVDLGFVGRPVEVNPKVLQGFVSSDFIPVVAPVGAGVDGETFNVNADTAAGAIAAAMAADRLLMLTDVEGVKNAAGEIMTDLTAASVRELTASGVISGGMIPKTQTALAAIDGGVRAVVILSGQRPNAVLLELFTAHGAGTLIRARDNRGRE
jgi:acetylglutamate kinase